VQVQPDRLPQGQGAVLAARRNLVGEAGEVAAAGDGDLAVLECLSQGGQGGASELGCLVEEEDAAVRQCCLARPGDPGATASHPGGRGRVVRGAERWVQDARVA
jgi:hypothetical protein